MDLSLSLSIDRHRAWKTGSVGEATCMRPDQPGLLARAQLTWQSRTNESSTPLPGSPFSLLPQVRYCKFNERWNGSSALAVRITALSVV